MKKFSAYLILLCFSILYNPHFAFAHGGEILAYALGWLADHTLQPEYTPMIKSVRFYDTKAEAMVGDYNNVYAPASYSCTGASYSAGFYYLVGYHHDRDQKSYYIRIYDGCGTIDSDRDGVYDIDDPCSNSFLSTTSTELFDSPNITPIDATGAEGANGWTSYETTFPINDDGCLDYGLDEYYESFALNSYSDCDGDGHIDTYTMSVKPIGGGSSEILAVGDPCEGVPAYSMVLVNPTVYDISQLDEIMEDLNDPAGMTVDSFEANLIDHTTEDIFADLGFTAGGQQFFADYTGDDWDYSEFYDPVTSPGELTITGTWSEEDYYRGMIEGNNNLGALTAQGFNGVTDGLGGVIDGLDRIDRRLADSLGSGSSTISGSINVDVDMSGVESRLDDLNDKFGETSFDNYGALNGLESDIDTAADTSGLFAGTDSDIPDVWAPDPEEHNTALDDHALTIQSFFDNFITFDVSGTSSFSATLLGKNIVFDFSTWESQINFFGSILVSFAGFTAFLIIFRR